MAPSTTEMMSDTTADVTGGRVTTSALLSAISEGLTTLQTSTPTPNNTLLPSVGENIMTSNSTDAMTSVTSVTSELQRLVDVTSEVMSTEAVSSTSPVITTQGSLIVEVTSDVTTQAGNNVMGGLGDVYTVIMTTEEPGFTLTPMHKWFIATGTVIFLVIILIIINCCLSHKERLEKTVKDVKHYAAEEKRVRREQNQINMEDTHGTKNQTHVFFSWMGSNKGGKQSTK